MTSSKRDFQDFHNKDEFNYFIKDGIIKFPILYNLDSKERLRIWDIYIELHTNIGRIDIKDMYINNDEINKLKKTYTDLHIKLYTISGINNMKMITSSPTIINKGKNISKSNETNIITQALIKGRSKFLKKIDNGYVLIINDKKQINKIFPMALHIYDKNKHKIEYPCYIQPKLDGIRMICYYENNKIKFKSRKLKDINGFSYIKDELEHILKKYPNIILDGELYCHGINLQEISGIVRNEIKSNTNKMLRFNIFDCFNKEKINWVFKDRMLFVNKITLNTLYSISVITDEIFNEEQGDKLYNLYIRMKYEGIIYKKINGLYKIGFNKELRSYDFLKRKQQFDDEFEIIGFESGTGKHLDAIVFILKTKEGKTFHSVPKWTIEIRKNIYNIAKTQFNDEYKGKMATVIYDDLSIDKIPLRSRISVIRDYE